MAAAHAARRYDVVVVGAGVAGIGVAAQLLAAGVHDLVVLEKAGRVGGVWRENTYPGCACDIPSAFYSYSFAKNARWKRFYGRQAEIREYLEATARSSGVLDKTLFECKMRRADWRAGEGRWSLETSLGPFSAQFVVFCTGPMHVPSYPKIPGLASFPGEMFHSAEWKHDVPLAGRRVAVVGTGASAIQFVPEIQPLCARLSVFQRTAPWVLPKRDFGISPRVQALFARFPVLQALLRAVLFVVFEVLNYCLRFPRFVAALEWAGRRNIARGVQGDAALLAKLTPTFALGCKRILQSNAWYPALAKPNAEVLPGIARVEGRRLFASDGSHCDADVVIFGTGFDVATVPIARYIVGASGRPLEQVWSGHGRGFLGTAVPDCPNAFVSFGPTTSSYSSAFEILECQVNLIVSAVLAARERGIATLAVKPQSCDAFNAQLQSKLKGTVWSTGCSSYFLTEDGVNTVNWPWTTLYLRYRLRSFAANESDFECRTSVPSATLSAPSRPARGNKL